MAIDYYASFFEADKLATIDFRNFIDKFKMQFRHYGLPGTVVSDNGALYNFADFAKFARDWLFYLWPPCLATLVLQQKGWESSKNLYKYHKEGNSLKVQSTPGLPESHNTPSDVGSSLASVEELLLLTKTIPEPLTKDVEQKFIDFRE